MSITHSNVVERWLQGLDAKGSSMFALDGVIYSYGFHHPIAWKARPGVFLINGKKVSVSTSKHTRIVSRAIKSRAPNADMFYVLRPVAKTVYDHRCNLEYMTDIYYEWYREYGESYLEAEHILRYAYLFDVPKEHWPVLLRPRSSKVQAKQAAPWMRKNASTVWKKYKGRSAYSRVMLIRRLHPELWAAYEMATMMLNN